MNHLLSFFLPLLYICGLTLLNSVIFRTRFQQVLLPAIMEAIAITVLFGFFDLRLGLAITVCMSVSSIPLYFYRKKQGYKLSDFFGNDTFLSFLIIFGFVFCLNLGKEFHHWDEYSHWGLMARESFTYNKYYYIEKSVLSVHREYPPMLTLWEYLLCKLSGGFKVSYLYNAAIVLGIIPVIDTLGRIESGIDTYNNGQINKKNRFTKVFGNAIIKSILVILLCELVYMADGSFYRSVYAESAIMFFTLSAIIMVLFPLENKSLQIVSLSLLLFNLAIVKQISIIFLVMPVGICLLDRLYKEGIKGNVWKKYYDIVLYILAGIVPWCIWNLTAKKYTAPGQFDASRFSMGAIIRVINGEGTAPQKKLINDYLAALWNRSLTSVLPLSYVTLFFIILTLLIILCIKNRENKGYRVLTIVLPLFMIVYVPVMLVLYLFGFSEQEMAQLACYTRYMNTCVGPIGLTVAVLYILETTQWLKNLCREKSGKIFRQVQNYPYEIICLAYMVFSALMIGMPRLKESFTPGIFTTSPNNIYEADAGRIHEGTEDYSKIYIVDTNANMSVCNIIRFLTPKRYISDGYNSPSLQDRDFLEKYLLNFDYVYICNMDDAYVENYGYLYAGEPVKEVVYRIEKKADGSLVLVSS